MLTGCRNNEEQQNPIDTLSKTSSILSNNNQNIFTSENEDFIYFVDAASLKRVSKADSSVTDIYKFDAADYPITAFECWKDRIYLILNKECFRINKETLKKEDISSVINIDNPLYEISNKKFFYISEKTYYIDSDTGEKCEL